MPVNSYLKAVLAAAVPLVLAVGEYLQSGALNAPEVSLALLALANAVFVYAFRNRPTGFLSAGKAIIASLNALVVALLTAYVTGDWSTTEWYVLVTGELVAILTYVAGNGPPSSPGAP
jgi:hypothetical protein